MEILSHSKVFELWTSAIDVSQKYHRTFFTSKSPLNLTTNIFHSQNFLQKTLFLIFKHWKLFVYAEA